MKLLFWLSFFICSYANSSSLMANRFLVYDILSGIFGPESHKILEEKILTEHQAFGGACSMMEKNIGEHEDNSSLYYCRNGSSESKNKAYSNNKVRRHALVMSACQKLVSNEKTFHFLKKTTQTARTPEERLDMVFKSFYPLVNTTKESINDIYKKVNSEISFSFFRKDEVFRKAVYYICISEKWQAL